MIGRDASFLAAGDTRDRVRENSERLKRGESIQLFEAKGFKKTGQAFDAAVTLFPVRDVKGGVVGAGSIVRDITENKKAQNRLQALHDIVLAVSSTLDLKACLEMFLRRMEEALPFPSASYFWLVNEDTGVVEAAVCRNINEAAWQAEGVRVGKNSKGKLRRERGGPENEEASRSTKRANRSKNSRCQVF